MNPKKYEASEKGAESEKCAEQRNEYDDDNIGAGEGSMIDYFYYEKNA